MESRGRKVVRKFSLGWHLRELNEMRAEAIQKAGTRSFQAEENHVRRPEVKYKFGMFSEQQEGQCKESRISSGRKRYWRIGLLRDLISHTLFSHSRSLDFTTPVRRSHWKVLREESYFSVSSRCSGQERGKNGSTSEASEEVPQFSR